MATPLKKQIEILVRLQSIETDQFKIEKALEKVPEKIAALDAGLTAGQEQIENENKRMDAVKKEYKVYESAIKDNMEKAKKSQYKLGEVKNNKEYQSILKEIDEIKEKNSVLEDKMLECLDFLDQAEARIGVAQSEFEALKKEIQEEKQQILEDSEKDREQKKNLEAARQDVLKDVNPKMLAQYEKVKIVVGRIAMAQSVNALCMACNMNMPPQRYNELMRCEEIILCPHCHRILYCEN